MPEPAAAPPSIYNQQSIQNGTGAGVLTPGPQGAPGAQGKPAGDDADIIDAVAKIFKASKKIAEMKDGAKPYVDRIQAALKEMFVDVFKKDPKDLDASAGGDAKPPADNATPPPDAGNPTPPPPAGAPA